MYLSFFPAHLSSVIVTSFPCNIILYSPIKQKEGKKIKRKIKRGEYFLFLSCSVGTVPGRFPRASLLICRAVAGWSGEHYWQLRCPPHAAISARVWCCSTHGGNDSKCTPAFNRSCAVRRVLLHFMAAAGCNFNSFFAIIAVCWIVCNSLLLCPSHGSAHGSRSIRPWNSVTKFSAHFLLYQHLLSHVKPLPARSGMVPCLPSLPGWDIASRDAPLSWKKAFLSPTYPKKTPQDIHFPSKAIKGFILGYFHGVRTFPKANASEKNLPLLASCNCSAPTASIPQSLWCCRTPVENTGMEISSGTVGRADFFCACGFQRHFDRPYVEKLNFVFFLYHSQLKKK